MEVSTVITAADIAYSNANNLIVQASTLSSIALVVTVLRCYVRLVMLKAFEKDYWTIIVSMLLTTIIFGCYVSEVPFGLGKHLAVIRMDKPKYRELLKIRLVHQVCVTAGVIMVKISIFSCIPITAIWDFRLRPPPMGSGNAKCLSNITFSQIAFFNTVVNIATDFLLALLPIPIVWNLSLSLRAKILLALVLSLGIFASVAGIMKAHVSKTMLNDAERFVYDRYSMWNFIELDVGIIAASLPTLKPLLNRFLQATRAIAASHPTKTSRYSFREPSSFGYAKQHDDLDTIIEMRHYKGKSETTVSLLSHFSDGNAWSIGRADSCDSLVLPIQGRDRDSWPS
ncbi:hypothetical protein BDW02DRAFT_630296 [Decorospora gaudefroyi]|uniref:Rhodopsin domain-containing protein n=1 Tax=Decorospora gaudefroyi TaxID=184978 RepID=A0A6A5KFU5_9PLEO|nr:hypothetical protein BDW02DRAFT_630296 [Decorospora gaudefroyi]